MALEALTLEELAGEDPRMLRYARNARRIADSDVALLIQGPTGSGKEAFAQAIHLASRRAGRPFIAVNCAAIPETLIESELFGYKPGAFTGAHREGMRGKIAQSSGGTLFLDEIGDMPLSLQSRLLRVVEAREVVPLGSERAVSIELHVISASQWSLRDLISRGAFREDLYYRLNGITIELPSLRERVDKENLIRRVLAAEAGHTRPAAIEQQALELLLAYAWPGNIRELRNVIRTALVLAEGGVVRVVDLPRELGEPAAEPETPVAAIAASRTAPNGGASSGVGGESLANPLALAERGVLLRVLEECHGNMTRVAARLGMSRSTLYRRMRRLEIPLRSGAAPLARGIGARFSIASV
ncbi:MAG TPA: sigma 54-interacting transcriptional regulator [Steroidobacteraceae bacterium]|nr:sigma 54-interacting transcriptional regulator [Steroidobacteraceae bacterium]